MIGALDGCGCFWMNPFVLDDVNMVPAILTQLPLSIRIIIPRLQSWLFQKSSIRDDERVITIKVGKDKFGDGAKWNTLTKGARMIEGVYLEITTIRGVVVAGEEQMADINEVEAALDEDRIYPCDVSSQLIQEIMDSGVEDWWLFLFKYEYQTDEEDVDELRRAPWFLVNYNKCRIFEGPDGECGMSFGSQM